MSEYAKAPSSPGLARVEDGVQSPREERVLIWPVTGDRHVHVSTITALGRSVVTHPRGEAGSQTVQALWGHDEDFILKISRKPLSSLSGDGQ